MMDDNRLAEIEARLRLASIPHHSSIQPEVEEFLAAYKVLRVRIGDLEEDLDSQTSRRGHAEIEMQKRGEENQRLLDALEAAKIGPNASGQEPWVVRHNAAIDAAKEGT